MGVQKIGAQKTVTGLGIWGQNRKISGVAQFESDFGILPLLELHFAFFATAATVCCGFGYHALTFCVTIKELLLL